MDTCKTKYGMRIGKQYIGEPRQYALIESRNLSMADRNCKEFLGLVLLLGLATAANARTIKIENGDTVDCIDIHRQPALDHPLLKGHIIQMKPNNHQKVPKGYKEYNYKSEECPAGTIPILRTTPEQIDQRPPKAFPVGGKRNIGVTSTGDAQLQGFAAYEYAVLSTNTGNYYGSHASINVWYPQTNPGEHSLAQTWLISGGTNGNPRNTIEAGWLVDSRPSLRTETRLFTYWTADNYQTTGCYNLECPGFVQVNQKMYPGIPLRPVSVYGGSQDDIEINISKDNVTGNWWLQVDGADIGYWPSNIFKNNLRYEADQVMWGGEVYPLPGSHHTTTEMGSGHFPNEGYTKSGYFRHVLPITEPQSSPDSISLSQIVTRPECYNLIQGRSGTDIYFYFGGLGYSPQCQ